MTLLTIATLIVALTYHSIGIVRHYIWFRKRRRNQLQS